MLNTLSRNVLGQIQHKKDLENLVKMTGEIQKLQDQIKKQELKLKSIVTFRLEGDVITSVCKKQLIKMPQKQHPTILFKKFMEENPTITVRISLIENLDSFYMNFLESINKKIAKRVIDLSVVFRDSYITDDNYYKFVNLERLNLEVPNSNICNFSKFKKLKELYLSNININNEYDFRVDLSGINPEIEVLSLNNTHVESFEPVKNAKKVLISNYRVVLPDEFLPLQNVEELYFKTLHTSFNIDEFKCTTLTLIDASIIPPKKNLQNLINLNIYEDRDVSYLDNLGDNIKNITIYNCVIKENYNCLANAEQLTLCGVEFYNHLVIKAKKLIITGIIPEYFLNRDYEFLTLNSDDLPEYLNTKINAKRVDLVSEKCKNFHNIGNIDTLVIYNSIESIICDGEIQRLIILDKIPDDIKCNNTPKIVKRK